MNSTPLCFCFVHLFNTLRSMNKSWKFFGSYVLFESCTLTFSRAFPACCLRPRVYRQMSRSRAVAVATSALVWLVLVLGFGDVGVSADPVTYTDAQAGLWSDMTTWFPSVTGYPTDIDTVWLYGGNTITVDVPSACGTLILDGNLFGQQLIVQADLEVRNEISLKYNKYILFIIDPAYSVTLTGADGSNSSMIEGLLRIAGGGTL